MGTYDIGTQHVASAGNFQIEIGFGDATNFDDAAVGDNATIAVPSKLTYVVGGFAMCMSTGGAVEADPLNYGCVTSQRRGTSSVADGHVDFTMDVTCAGKFSYMLFGY